MPDLEKNAGFWLEPETHSGATLIVKGDAVVTSELNLACNAHISHYSVDINHLGPKTFLPTLKLNVLILSLIHI